ncbi:MAG: APC family permease [Acholeplasmatales bacterium]|nr:APC family permease [Acholeplasmatales bacterium]
MDNKLEKKYGLFMAICMVVGIAIGSGVFFKAQDMLNYTGGNVWLGVIAWLLGGAVMIICAAVFANFATKYEKVNGLVDYSEAIVGKKYGLFMGWFVSTIYYPAMTGVLAWVSARYTLVLFGSTEITGGLCMALAGTYLIAIYALNTLSPKLSAKFHISSTVIKLIPLVIMIIVGSIVGLVNGNTIEAFKAASSSTASGSLFAAICAGAFAYEGWIIATSINSEVKDAKKNLPIALVLGTAIIMLVYILYFIALTGGASIDSLISEGSTKAFTNIFGSIGGTILNAFIVISCLGTLNGLMVACTRGMYSISIRMNNKRAEFINQVDKASNMPTNSSIIGLLLAALWCFYFYAANLNSTPLFGVFSFDSSELPIITIYGMYLPIFVMFIVKEGKKNIFKNIVLPVLAIIASLFMIFCAVYAHGVLPYLKGLESGTFSFPILFYLIIFVVIMGIGVLYMFTGKNKENEVKTEQE